MAISAVTTSDAEQPMPLRRYAWDQRERSLCVSYATFAINHSTRRYEEGLHETRSPFERDRDRVLHSAAFRRLSGKMQVFTGEMGDYHRTRLTHTQEVASIARTIGRALRLNEDLIEALALLHDIGHPPFGHCGEDLLDECARPSGGFSHNRFATTLVEELESRYSIYPGLNLTSAVLEGQHVRANKQLLESGNPVMPGLEVQVVDLADSITYNAHDVDDALKLGLIGWQALRTLDIVRLAERRARRGLSVPLPAEKHRPALVHALIDLQVEDLVLQSQLKLSEFLGADRETVRVSGLQLALSKDLAMQRRQLEVFLFDRVYRHPRLMEVRLEATEQLRTLFQLLESHPGSLPVRFQKRAEVVGTNQAVTEYLAGLTDRACVDAFRQLREANDAQLADW